MEPKYFDFSDIDEVTVFSDNVLPAVLRKLGILEVVDSDLAQTIATRQALPSGECRRARVSHDLNSFAGDQEVELRLCAVYACKKVVECVSSSTSKLGRN